MGPPIGVSDMGAVRVDVSLRDLQRPVGSLVGQVDEERLGTARVLDDLHCASTQYVGAIEALNGQNSTETPPYKVQTSEMCTILFSHQSLAVVEWLVFHHAGRKVKGSNPISHVDFSSPERLITRVWSAIGPVRGLESHSEVL